MAVAADDDLVSIDGFPRNESTVDIFLETVSLRRSQPLSIMTACSTPTVSMG